MKSEQRFPSAPTGPFCYLRQNRHDEPFAKRDRARRAERRFKDRRRQESLASRERDDGYFSMEGEDV